MIRTGLAMLLLTGAAQAAACRLEPGADIPLTMLDRYPMAAASINGQPAQLIYDTGGAGTMLTAGAVAKFGLTPTPNPPKANFTSSGVPLEVTFSHVQSLEALGASRKDFDIPVIGDMGVDGNAGQDIMARDTEIDLAHHRLRVFTPTDCATPAQAHWAEEDRMQVLMIADRTRIFGTVSVNGVELTALFDTGSPYSALTADAAARAGVHPGDPGVTQTHASHGLNGKVGLDSWVAGFNDITIGGETIEKPRLEFILKHNYSADMILGADFFLAHRVLISKDQHRLYFQYNGAPIFGSHAKPVGG